MGTRIDELEQSINDLKAEMGTDGGAAIKPEETKPSPEPKWRGGESQLQAGRYPFLFPFFFFFPTATQKPPRTKKVNHVFAKFGGGAHPCLIFQLWAVRGPLAMPS